MDGVFGGAAAPFSTVAAAHSGSLAEPTRGCFLRGEQGAHWFLGVSGAWGPRVLGGMSLSCHDRPWGCGLDLGCEVKPASYASYTGSAA